MINSYTDFIQAAQSQPEPQRLLFVFCKAELPDDASEEEKAAFERGEGGALAPTICVDKAPEEVADFEQLMAESHETGFGWDMAFVGALSGRGGIAPTTEEAQQPLTMMVEAIRMGHIGNFLAVNARGELVSLG
ncbi:ribonucleotide reductase subunit alpha [Marinobacteraceae bacterium S3BR75-40.1]